MSLTSKLSPPTKPAADAATELAGAGAQASGPVVPSVLVDCMSLSTLPQLLCDALGKVLIVNETWRAQRDGRLDHIQQLPPELLTLIGWPSQMPARGESRRREGWAQGSNGHTRHWRITTRGVSGAVGRWLVQLEDLRLEDARELAEIEINALMGSAGLGVATHDAVRGWVTAGPGSTEAAAPAAGAGLAASQGGPTRSSLLSVGRDMVEPESLPEYERLQSALRQRHQTEVRYAVHHPEAGLRWLQTRVEPADLTGGRNAITVVTMDVTEEERARQRNDQLLHELSTILDGSPAGIAYLRGGVLVRCNARFESLLGLAAGAGQNLSAEELLTRCAVEPTAVRQALNLLQLQGSFETEFQPADARSDGETWFALALRRAGPSDEVVAALTDVSRLRTQQAELEGLERERELMFSLSDVGIVYQRDGRIERANQAMAELTGRSQSDLQGLPLSELYEDEALYLHYAAQERRDLAQYGRATGERRLLRRDGSTFWVQASQRLVDLADPSVGSISSFVNVDEKRRAQESLLAQADRTRAILDSVLVGIVTVGEHGIEWMNRSARRMFGGELQEFVGLPMSVVASAEQDHPLRRTDWFSTLEEGQAETFECRLKARDGRTYWVVGNVVSTGRETGTSQLTFALLDIERRREAENSIAQARASLQRIIETAPLAIALFDGATQQVLQLNQTMCAFSRRTADEILGRQPSLWLPGVESAALSADLHLASASHETVRRELHRAADGDGGEPSRVWDMRIVSVADASGTAGSHLLLVASDVTEQRAAEEARLAAAIAQREMLIKEVHHRIKNNLQGVAGLLQQNAHRHPEASNAIAEAVGHVHAIAQVHGLQVGMTGPLRVRAVVEAIAQSVQRMFGRHIEFSVQGAEPMRFALTEPDSIPVALTVNELLTNAIKHSNGGAIACQMVCGEDDVVLRVFNPGTLMAGFNLAQIPAGISGLGLVRALLPRKGAAISLEQEGHHVVASLRLAPPAVALVRAV